MDHERSAILGYSADDILCDESSPCEGERIICVQFSETVISKSFSTEYSKNTFYDIFQNISKIIQIPNSCL